MNNITNNNKIVPIFFSTDDNYVPFLLITMESIVNNASSDRPYIFYILNNGLGEFNKERIMMYNKRNFKVEFVDVSEKMHKFGEALHAPRDYYTKAIYYRLFIPSLFPNYDKALYLDCDIAVLGDIANLYDTDLENNLVGAVPDEAVSLVKEFQNYTDKYLGVKPENYFNSGVLLMNLKQLRAIDFEQKFINIFGSYTFEVAPDQDCLNVICKDKVTYVDLSWNKMPFQNPNYNLNNLNLIHYNLSYKPWRYDDIAYQDAFWKYAKSCGLENDILEIKSKFTPEHVKKDQIAGQKLIALADKQSKLKDTFASLLESGEIDKQTFLRIEKYDVTQAIKDLLGNIKDKMEKQSSLDKKSNLDESKN